MTEDSALGSVGCQVLLANDSGRLLANSAAPVAGKSIGAIGCKSSGSIGWQIDRRGRRLSEVSLNAKLPRRPLVSTAQWRDAQRMRPLRPQTRELVEHLRPGARSLFSRMLGRNDPCSLIEEIGLTGDPAAIMYLIPYLLGEPPEARAAAQAVAHILGAKRARVLLQLEQLRHGMRQWSAETGWHALSSTDISRLGGLPDGWAALGLASWHPSGYVREAAVHALARRSDKGKYEIPFLLLRLNDWVPEVRRAAQDSFAARVDLRYADALVRALPLLLALRERRRVDHDALVESVLALLRSPAGRPALVRGTESSDPTVRRECFRLMLEADDGVLDCELLNRALGDLDVIVRGFAARSLLRLAGDVTTRTAAPAPTKVAPEALRELLDRALRDPAVRIRAAVLPLAAAQPPEWRHDIFDRLLCDPHAPIRTVARAELSRLVPGHDAAAHYRALLTASTNTRQLRGALPGLAESGVEEDVLLVLPWLTEPRASIRAAALHATAMLDMTSIEPLVDALRDPTKRISRAAAQIIARRPHPDLLERLIAIVHQEGVAPHVREHALDLICTTSPWLRLWALLRITASACSDAAERAAQRLRPPTSQRPTPDELRSIDAALPAASLPPAVMRELVDALRVWRQ